MATSSVTVSDSAWTLIVPAETTAYITSNGIFNVLFQQQASLPAAGSTVGHPIPADGYTITVGTGENLYAKSAKGSAAVIVTAMVAIVP